MALTSGLSRTAPPSEIGFDRTRSNDVDPDTTGAEFLGHIPGEYFYRALGRCVRGISGDGETGEAGRHVQDPAAVLDQRQQRLAEKERRFHMNGQKLVELFFGGFLEAGAKADAGIVDEEIEPFALELGSELGANPLLECAKFARIADVEFNHHCLAAKGLDFIDERLRLIGA
jgi:hypothetical protein